MARKLAAIERQRNAPRRNFEVTEELREHVEKRFQRVGNQVSNLALLDVEFSEDAPLPAFEPGFPA